MSEAGIIIRRTIIQFAVLVGLALLPPACVYIDIVVLDNGVGEISLTETTQEALILACALTFLRRAMHDARARGLLVLVGGFFLAMFIRELDYLFDNIAHGFWQLPMTTVALSSIVYARVGCRGTVLLPMAAFATSRPFAFMMTGLLIVLVFSRVFGSGSLLWQAVLGEHYSMQFRSAVQEGLELFGYLFIAYATALFSCRDRASP